jgi:hypothetical protein
MVLNQRIGHPWEARTPLTGRLWHGRAEGHVVFTQDLDFGILLSLTQDAGPSVIQIRTLDTFPEANGQRLVQALQMYEAYLLKGALVTVDERRNGSDSFLYIGIAHSSRDKMKYLGSTG